MSSRSSFFDTLPTLVSGKRATSNRSGNLKVAIVLLEEGDKLLEGRAHPRFAITYAQVRSPRIRSGIATTATLNTQDGQDEVLDLFGGDLFATPIDHVLLVPFHDQVAAAVEPYHIAVR